MYKTKQRVTGFVSSTKLTVKSNRSNKETKDGKEKRSNFSFELERTSQQKVSLSPSKEVLPKQQGNWTQFWLGVLFTAIFAVLQILLSS
jgi:hypothetical protein